jgi:catechol 2,3-dioxygenase
MSALSRTETPVSIDPATHVGFVALGVADLDRSLRFYTEDLGLSLLARSSGEVVLGADRTPLLGLHEQPGALPWMVDRMTGLYHFAILVPSRADLGLWLRHFLSRDYPPPGQGDHLVSEALYLRDPDGHGIEVYRDRPRDGWQWENGQVRMGGGPVDIRGVLAEADASGRAWTGLAPGTTLGHVHLQVGDIGPAEEFYHGVLGFDVVSRSATALFVSAGGYHHHLGLNVWHSRGAPPAPADTATLRCFTFALPAIPALDVVTRRVAEAGCLYKRSADTLAVRDPWQHHVVLHVGDIDRPERLTVVADGTG